MDDAFAQFANAIFLSLQVDSFAALHRCLQWVVKQPLQFFNRLAALGQQVGIQRSYAAKACSAVVCNRVAYEFLTLPAECTRTYVLVIDHGSLHFF